ncbi:hypothetical protein [Streptomyces shenzhenensis]|uniref:hypothetical protein n=1 Tax=Streptomyces shenzhenensis TaxID=943815 RepID=UPI0033E23344
MSQESDLVVDYDLLSTSARQLAQIRHEFKGLAEWKREVRSVLGDSRVQSAMDDFVDNWDNNRKRLVKEIEDVGKMVKATGDAFREFDDELARAAKGKK